jgi:hypothetical protein
MADLAFDCVGARAEPYAVTPTLTLALRITETSGAAVHAIALRCQIRIEPQRRRYSDAEARRLHDLFGDTSRWADTLKPLQLTNLAVMVPGFTGTAEVDLPVPCTYDLEIASTRYCHSLDDGTVALLLLFSGTVFVKTPHGFAVEQVPWSAEAGYCLPVATWREMVDRYFPNSGWIRCDRSTLDALSEYKSRHALPTWDGTIQALLAAATAPAAPMAPTATEPGEVTRP